MDKIIIPFISIEEIIESLPHKFRNGKNVNIILNAYYKQYEKIINTFVECAICYDIDTAIGDNLDKIGSNFMVRRDNSDDESYRLKIKLAYAVYKTSGNIYNISKVLIDFLGIDPNILYIYESGNANIVLELNRDNKFDANMVSAINDIIRFSKPVGVGFSTEPYSSTILLDKYTNATIESIIDRVNKRYMMNNIKMDNAYHMYTTYFMNCSVDRWHDSKIEN